MTSLLVNFTAFRKANGPLTKHIELIDGKIGNDTSACFMSRGAAWRVELDSATTIADFINKLGQNEAFALGRIKDGHPDRVKVVTAAKVKDDPAVIARSLKYLVFAPGEPGLSLLDIDLKGISDTARRQIDETGGIWKSLCAVCPQLESAANVRRASTSSGLTNTITGETYPGSGGFHVFVAVADAADVSRFLSDLHDRLWLAGLGWGWIGGAGQFLERSLIDKAVGSPERLIFEGPPIIMPPLAQAPRPAIAHEGDVLDTNAACLALTASEAGEVRRLKEAERARLKPAMDVARAKWSETHVKRLVAAGKTEIEAKGEVERSLDTQQLSGDFPLPFDDQLLAGATVADVLRAPNKYVGKTLADPFEGPSYGRGKAVLYRNEDRSLIIHSFAHGGVNYELKDGTVGAGFEDSVALTFAERHVENYRYVAATGKWMIWRGTRWQAETTLAAFDAARVLCREAVAHKDLTVDTLYKFRDAVEFGQIDLTGLTGAINLNFVDEAIKGLSYAKTSADAKVVSAVEKLAKSDRRLATELEQWDNHPWLLATPGGTVDLRTGELREARREDYITRQAAFAPAPRIEDGGKPPDMWLSFLDRVFDQDDELIAFLKRFAGYCLTGDISEHCLLFAHGEGCNGKGVFCRVLQGILGGDLSNNSPIEMFL